MRRSRILQSKWIVGTNPGQKVTQAARLALCQRLSVTQEYIRLAAKRIETDVDLVHQLRISTRRSQAALQIFSDLLPPLSRDKTITLLRKLRRAAGKVRDLDVLVLRLGHRAETSSDARLAALVACMGNRREAAERALAQARKKLTRQEFDDSVATLIKRIEWRHDDVEPEFVNFAQQVYRSTADEFLTAATADLSAECSLHQMRLAGKKLRYTLELLSGVFEPAFRDSLYPAVQEIQEKLGRINDHVTASLLLDEWRADFAPHDREAVAHLAHEERGFAEATGRQFRAWWTPLRIDDLHRNFEQIRTIPDSPAALDSMPRGRDIA
ncbi:MAG: CHAD domain-containing protein [Planctomycetaceae bacterium]